MLRRPMRIRFAVVVLALVASACTPSIGDSCNTAFDCSINGDRQCDLARPNGACTVFSCEADTCPDDSVCVRWRPEPSRLTFTACMRNCEEDGNCRFDEGYRCMAAEEVTLTSEGGIVVAEVTDSDPNRRFCVSTDPNGGD